MNMRWMFWTGFLVFALDQTSKYLVVHTLNLKTIGSMEILPPFLNFKMAWNRGVNFGLFSNDAEVMKWVLIILALLISVWVAIWVRREGGGQLSEISAGLLIGGAIGNVTDRLVYGAVADFLNMSCCGLNKPYSFNVADIAVFAGAVGIILFSGNKKSA
jgi:signal peptidase II